ncbi:MAG: M949_RS01915 family surface polysaccharide biosynthesis protein [Flammeovirgaceae bacterium]
MKIHYLFLMLCLLIACSSTEQKQVKEDVNPKKEEKNAPNVINTKEETLTALPPDAKTLGSTFLTGRKWQDANGENLLLCSSTKKVDSNHPSGQDATTTQLYIEHFTKKEGNADYLQLRKIEVTEKNCVLTNLLELNQESIQITDLDGDNYKEISFVYLLGCTNRFMSIPMELIVLENGEEYTMSGMTRSEHVLLSRGIAEGALIPQPNESEKIFNASFDKAPPTFKQFASELWNNYEMEKSPNSIHAFALSSIPTGVKALGEAFIAGGKWMDANGENLLICTLSEKVTPGDPNGAGGDHVYKQLYVEHFTKKESATDYTLMRKIQDIQDCNFSNMLALSTESIRITDLDQDQYAEISFVYNLGCRSDVSRDPMKLMLLENGEKYAIRGQTRFSSDSPDKNFDEDFAKAPANFKDFASELWDQYESR